MLYLYRGKIHSQMGLYACIWDEQFKLNESLPKVNSLQQRGGKYQFYRRLFRAHTIIPHEQSLECKGIDSTEVKNMDFGA